MKHQIFAVLSILLVPALASLPANLNAHADLSLATYLLQRDTIVKAAEPGVWTQCFSTYLPLLQKAADQWALDYNNCINNASTGRSTLMTQMDEEQHFINDSATAVCANINKCQTIMDPLGFFNCFADFAPNEINIVYAISANASEAAAELLQQLEQIEAEMYKCTNATERVYVETSSRLYDELDYCLVHGLIGISSSSTTSTTTSSTTGFTKSSTTSSTSTPKTTTTRTSTTTSISPSTTTKSTSATSTKSTTISKSNYTSTPTTSTQSATF